MNRSAPLSPGAGRGRSFHRRLVFFRSRRRQVYGVGMGALALIFALSLPEPLFDPFYSPVLTDREGRFLGALVAADGQWRFPPGEGVNEKFAAALMESEDRRFRFHPGVDPLALGRALILNLRSGKVVSGGSTLTMQTIRLARRAAFRVRGTVPRRGLFEKGMEAILALRLELGVSKERILSLYAANAPFGANVVGLEAASWRWFGRGAEELSWAEAAALAVLPNNPSLIHPGRNRELLREKRDALLERLWEKGFFDDETLSLSQMETIPEAPLPLPREAPHLLARLVREQGGLEAFTAASLSSSAQGRLQSTLDRDIQERARLIMERAADRFAGNGILNGACLILHTPTGEALAYVGNVDSPSAAAVDIVTAPRSSGSLLKPFLYAAMLDSGDLLPAALVSDIPTRVGSYGPENISRTYLGVVPADEALARSLNVPAVRSLGVYGVDRFTRLLRTLGLSTLFRPAEEYGLPLILGGAEVNLWEITGLYAALGRAAGDGGFFPPRLFPKPGHPGPAETSHSAERPISPGAAWLTLEALCFAVRPGEEAHWQEYAGGRRIAWKTGTSFGYRDAWAVGVSPEWTLGVWIGNATGEGRAELRSAVTAAPVLFELFSALNARERGSGGWFPQPIAEMKFQEVCAYSGLPPGPDCFSFKTTLLPREAPPHQPCPYCKTITLNAAKTRRVLLDGSSGLPVVPVKRFILPPAEEWYYRRWNLDYQSPPPFEQDGSGGSTLAAQALPLALLSPAEGVQVLVPRELDGSEGRVVFSAAHREAEALIHWHLDGEYLGSSAVFHEMEARPPPGPHTLTLVDGAGNTLIRRFKVLSPLDEAGY